MNLDIPSPKTQGPWSHRLGIRVLTLVFGVLVYWVLGFLVEDVARTHGPTLDEVEQRYVDASLLEREEALRKSIRKLGVEQAAQKKSLEIIESNSNNLQNTINQLIELQRLSVEKATEYTPSDQTKLTESLQWFLASQKDYQRENEVLAKLAAEQRQLQRELSSVQRQLDQQRRPALAEFKRLHEDHRLDQATYQLAILVPLLILGAGVLWRRSSSQYRPIYLGYTLASALKVSLVVHDYFPSRYFKYILVGALLLVVLYALVYFIRSVAQPKTQWLLQQYRDAYERFLCPVCEYPIRTGPRTFLYWTRRTVNKVGLPGDQGQAEPHTCPHCGTALYETCPDCGGVRHALLPYCQHCGSEKAIEAPDAQSKPS